MKNDWFFFHSPKKVESLFKEYTSNIHDGHDDEVEVEDDKNFLNKKVVKRGCGCGKKTLKNTVTSNAAIALSGLYALSNKNYAVAATHIVGSGISTVYHLHESNPRLYLLDQYAGLAGLASQVALGVQNWKKPKKIPNLVATGVLGVATAKWYNDSVKLWYSKRSDPKSKSNYDNVHSLFHIGLAATAAAHLSAY